MGDNRLRGKGKKAETMENLALETHRFSRNLLQSFNGGEDKSSNKAELVDEEEEEIELNLGLSLGGRFGIDKSSNKLVRASSIASCLPVVRDDDAAAPPPPAVAYSNLIRTSSLPVETEEEWRKRKELQTMRRMEAKRRRSEKQRNSSGIDAVRSLRGKRSNSNLASCNNKVLGFGQFSSQGSIESQGGSSSSMSELESHNKSLQGSGEPSPGSMQSLQEGRGNQETGSSQAKTETPTLTPSENPSHRAREVGTSSLEDMPCVFTKGDSPNGKRIDGILYKYGKGEEVRIMCVCHGSFLSPAEFVKHAGGTDVTHPLKHIVINPGSSSSFR